MNVQPVLSVRGLDTRFATGDGVVHAVDHVSFDLMAGEVLGIVGESGSGKSVTALSVMKLVVCPPGQVSAGEITLDGEDILHIDEAQARHVLIHAFANDVLSRISLDSLRTYLETALLKQLPMAVLGARV